MTTAPLPTDADVATLLRRFRRAQGLTQEELAERAGVSVGAISYLERGLTHAPQRDTLRALAQALALNEQEAAALQNAVRRERMEAPEAPTAPVETEQNARAIGQAIGGELPRPLTGLIGRERETAAILAMLARERIQLLTLTGPAGVGKTRLAIEVARRGRDGWKWEVAFVNLTHTQNPARVLPEIAQALGLRDGDTASPREALVAALAQRELLLILDNVEQVVAAAPLLLDLLGACPGLKALVTSRIALNVRGEREFAVTPLALPADEAFATPEEMEQVPSIALFLERARAIRPNFALTTAEEARQVAAICARLDGLPLAIELAAAQMRHLSLAELLRRLNNEAPLNALTGGAQDLPDHQRAMRSAITWSYRLLGSEEQRVFRALSVFAGGATVEGLAAVTERDHVALEALLETLVGHSVVYPIHLNSSIRYAQLVTLRAYGLERLAEHGELPLTRRRHAEYYAALAREERLPDTRCDPDSMALTAEEYENIRAALGWALEAANRPDAADKDAIWTGLRLAGALWFWWEVRGLLVEGLDWLERLVAIAPEAEDDASRAILAMVWTGVTALSYRLGRFERAYAAGEQALAVRRQLGDRKELMQALGNQGIVSVATLRFEVGEDHHQEALDLSAQMGHPPMEFIILLNMASLRRCQRRHAEALAFCRQSQRLAEQTEEYGEARAILWNNIGLLHILLGEPAEAVAALDRSEALFRQLDSAWGIALCAHDLGRAHLALDQLEEAASELMRAITLRELHGDGVGAARSRVHLARVRLALGDLPVATELLREALRAATRLRQADALWAVIEAGAALACAWGQSEEAGRLYAVAILQRDALWDTIDPSEYARRDRDLAAICAALGESRYEQISADMPATLEEALSLLDDVLI